MTKNKISAIGPSLPCIILSWVHAVLLFGGLYAFFADYAGITGRSFWLYAALGFLFIIPACISWLLLKKITFIFSYLLIGLSLSIGLGLLEGQFTKGLFTYSQGLTVLFTSTVSMAMFAIHTAARITHGNLKKDFLAAHGDDAVFELEVWEVPNILSAPSLIALVWFLCLYLLGVAMKLTMFWHIVFYLSLCEIIICFMHKYLFGFTDFLQKSRKSANVPVSTIKHVHKTVFIIASVLLILSVLPAVLYNREPLANLTHQDVDIDMDYVPDYVPSNNDPIVMDMDEVLAEMGIEIKEYPAWIGKMIQLITWGFVLMAGLVLMASVIHSIRDAIVDFNVEDEDEIVFLDSEETDAIAAVKATTKSDGILSVNAQIRRRYKKTIKKATKGTPSSWATPTELERDAGIDQASATKALHTAYEKARYSKDGCTRDDLSTL